MSKMCPLCENELQYKGEFFICSECNRYFPRIIIEMPTRLSTSFYDLPERDQIAIAKERMKQ